MNLHFRTPFHRFVPICITPQNQVILSKSGYKGKIKPLIESKSTPWKIVEGDHFHFDKGTFADLLQTQDYVANAARGKLEIGDSKRTEILKMRIHKIQGGDLDEF